MNIIVKGSHIEITSAIHEYLEKRLQALEKFLDDASIIQADLGKTTNHHKMEIFFEQNLILPIKVSTLGLYRSKKICTAL